MGKNDNNDENKTRLNKFISHNSRFSRREADELIKAGKVSIDGKVIGDLSTKVGYKTIVKVNPKYFRPAEVEKLIGDFSKAKKDLGWQPKTKFDELVEIMVKSDLEKFTNA